MTADAAASARDVVELAAVRRRLELALAATYGRALAVEPAPAPPAPGWWARLLRRTTVPGADGAMPCAGTDGLVLRLPPQLPGAPHGAVARFRALAHVQAERALRGAGAHAPVVDPDALQVALQRAARDLYDAWDGAAAVRAALARVPALAPAIAALADASLASRPAPARLTPAEARVEDVVRGALAALANAARGGDAGPVLDDALAADDAPPDVARARALAAAGALLAECPGGLGARMTTPYRGLAPVALWGALDVAATRTDAALPIPPRAGEGRTLPPSRIVAPPNRKGRRVRRSRDDEQPHVQVAAPDGETPDAPDAIDDPRGRLREAPGTSGVGRAAGDTRTERGADEDPAAPGAVQYPEWDARERRLVPDAVRVIVPPPVARDEAAGAKWAARALGEHAALVRAVRARFERLRARRERLPAQRDGAELDLDACVRALVERRAGGTPSDRLYVAVRPARRAVAIAVVVDTSGSTDAPVSDRLQVIDVERRAALLAAEALDALGDPFALVAFSSYGARQVEVPTLKAFGEKHGARVRARIGALRPGGNTRLGAALRHATALLARQPAGHRLLLLVSDGRPNDADGYTGAAAVDDARQAVLEARASGVVTFCLTVGAADRDGPEYLPTVFGPTGYTVLRDPTRLPDALLGAVRHMLGTR